ncbi:putative sjogren's syndrome/scleroderma autoantigen 1 (Autoantigen p27) [Lyophyllum shimeji]|uniref:Sjogren's syndrome/scleroderma autoantigen 1 (Autoantigen p27) n=1 Tax=Lyophyllum shimeji TaxID=47721 RepID=A0A9P3PE16_LYOSH|nr:putative sjogren's syndrome/scleroderma autoantigen 1 (Autoantigen p27) [Lyophyllum shimeji]
MDSVADVSGRLGEYMLKGWVLTDQTCKSPGCSVPLMRSPKGRTPVVMFCANCDESPGVPRPKPTIPTSESASSATSGSEISRSSTPPTEVSSALSSPVFAPPAETEESRRRRQQSDTASAEIGKRLLKGWAMLGDECPNSRCYGVPLVRPPMAGGQKDPRKECVICETVYVTEADWTGREHLVPMGSNAPQPNNTGALDPSMPADNQPRHEIRPDVTPAREPVSSAHQLPSTSAVHSRSENSTVRGSYPDQALEESSLALQSTLRMLSSRLGTLSGSGAMTDPSSIGQTADAISKVTQALSHVRQLQWSESCAKHVLPFVHNLDDFLPRKINNGTLCLSFSCVTHVDA